MSLTDTCIKRPVLAWMIMAFAILFGVVAAQRIGVSQMPDVDSPDVTVMLPWPGAAPEEVERGIVEPLEQALAQVEGVEQIQARARQGMARLTVRFGLDRNIDFALQDVQAKVSQAQRQLPKDVQQPTISKSNPDDQPLLTVGLRGPFSKHLLSDVARYQIQQKLQTVPGVGQILTMGFLNRSIRLWVDPVRLVERGVTIAEVINALERQHVAVPGGQLQIPGRDITVQVLGEALDLSSFRNIVIAEKNGAPVYLKNIALVEDGFEDIRTIARLDGVPLQALNVLKQRGANAVAVAAAVRKEVAELRKTLPPGLDLEILFDTSTFVEESVHEIQVELLLAVLLTSLVCLLFLGSFSGTINVLLAIPMSLLGTIAIIWACGFTINTFTLLGLSLSIGLVVDDAVMVMENIFRHGQMGKDGFRAAAEGTREITFAAMSATAAVVAIFLPVVFMEGIVGKYFLQFGVTLAVAVCLSYIEAVTLAPARCARLFKHGEQHSRFMVLVDNAFQHLSGLYLAALKFALKHPWGVLLIAVAVTAGCFVLGLKLPSEFSPSQDQSRLVIRAQAPPGSNVYAADEYAKKIEKILQHVPEITSVMVQIFNDTATITARLIPPNERALTQQQLSAKLRKVLQKIPGPTIALRDPSQQGLGSSKGSPLEISVRGQDWPTLIGQAMQLRAALASSGVVVDLETDYEVGLPEVLVEPDRARAADLGVSMQDLGATINSLIGGVTVGKYSAAGRRMDIRMRLLKEYRTRPEDIGNLYMRSANGGMVPLSTLVDIVERPVLQSINRVDRERAISLQGNIAPGHAQSEAIELVQKLSRNLPLGYRAVLSGQSSDFDLAMRSLIFALLFGIAAAYMVLGAQFNSFLHPVTVLTILPLSVAGAFVGLWSTGHNLNIYSMIGILLLMGITKKNSIILVDYAIAARDRGKSALDSMLEAGPTRLRPILMTTSATIMATVPTAIGLGIGSETRSPMAIAVLSGLILSTMLSLFVVPAFYLVADNIKARLAALFSGQ